MSSGQHHYSYWSEATLELSRSHSSQIDYVSEEEEDEEVLSEKSSSRELASVSDTKLELESAFTESGSTPPPETGLRPESQDSLSNSESQGEDRGEDSKLNLHGPDSELGVKLEPQDTLAHVSLLTPPSPPSPPLSSVSLPSCGSLRTSNFAKVTASFLPETASNPVLFTSFRASRAANVKRLSSESLHANPRGKFQPKNSKFGKKSFTLKADTLQKRRDISVERSSINSKEERETEARTEATRMPGDSEQCVSPPSSPDMQKHSPEELATIQARVRASLEQQGVVSGSSIN